MRGFFLDRISNSSQIRQPASLPPCLQPRTVTPPALPCFLFGFARSSASSLRPPLIATLARRPPHLAYQLFHLARPLLPFGQSFILICFAPLRRRELRIIVKHQ
ncbi:hypothetical protein MSAN_01744300 [Mycena sanguinolenta]|uniref:Uncharacterized protein n=1 Tax=Mycena sanguinolenta TaxID=230812 RepID=A0A8H7CT93_9AGAR|nr:hypothetical protein MSAN_01744300 [Mycena sanguinolenta]